MKRLHLPARRGATLVEFALVVPVLLLLMLGVMEFGWYAKNQLALANATREGARAASIGQTDSNIRQRIINSALPVVVTSSDITLKYSTDSGASYVNFPPDNSLKSPPQNGVPAGSLVKVTVAVAHHRLINLPITPPTVGAKVSMLRERT